jgi:hypothetical protein
MKGNKASDYQLQATPSIDLALDQAIEFLTTPSAKPPAPEAVVEALLQAEKTAKQAKVRHAYSQLLGAWRLGFITGTKRSRQRAGVILGAGRFLPKWVNITLSYFQSESGEDRGTVENSVKLGPLQLVVTGPTRFWQKTNMLAFDFTRIKVSLSGLKLYEGYIRGGQDRELRFWEQSVKEQAFFTYFLAQDQGIAARGRGGGLALWTRA